MTSENPFVSPEKIIDLLNKLSPEKLQVIKLQVFNKTSTDAEAPAIEASEPEKTDEVQVSAIEKPVEDPIPDAEKPIQAHEAASSGETFKMNVDEVLTTDPPEEQEDPLKPHNDEAEDSDDCVILSDTEDDKPTAIAAKPVIEPGQSILKSITNSNGRQDKIPLPPVTNAKRKSGEIKEKPDQKIPKKSKECVNPDCPRGSDEYIDAPIFILNFYYTARKGNKAQFVCTTCYNKAVDKFEVRGRLEAKPSMTSLKFSF